MSDQVTAALGEQAVETQINQEAALGEQAAVVTPEQPAFLQDFAKLTPEEQQRKAYEMNQGMNEAQRKAATLEKKVQNLEGIFLQSLSEVGEAPQTEPIRPTQPAPLSPQDQQQYLTNFNQQFEKVESEIGRPAAIAAVVQTLVNEELAPMRENNLVAQENQHVEFLKSHGYPDIDNYLKVMAADLRENPYLRQDPKHMKTLYLRAKSEEHDRQFLNPSRPSVEIPHIGTGRSSGEEQSTGMSAEEARICRELGNDPKDIAKYMEGLR